MSRSLPSITMDFDSSASANSATPAQGILKLRRPLRSSSASEHRDSVGVANTHFPCSGSVRSSGLKAGLAYRLQACVPKRSRGCKLRGGPKISRIMIALRRPAGERRSVATSVPLPRSVNEKRAPLQVFDPLRNDPRFQKLAGRGPCRTTRNRPEPRYSCTGSVSWRRP